MIMQTVRRHPPVLDNAVGVHEAVLEGGDEPLAGGRHGGRRQGPVTERADAWPIDALARLRRLPRLALSFRTRSVPELV